MTLIKSLNQVNITSNGKSLIHVPLDATLRKTHHNFWGNQEEMSDTHKLRDILQKKKQKTGQKSTNVKAKKDGRTYLD